MASWSIAELGARQGPVWHGLEGDGANTGRYYHPALEANCGEVRKCVDQYRLCGQIADMWGWMSASQKIRRGAMTWHGCWKSPIKGARPEISFPRSRLRGRKSQVGAGYQLTTWVSHAAFTIWASKPTADSRLVSVRAQISFHKVRSGPGSYHIAVVRRVNHIFSARVMIASSAKN
jgi:hypothetical protein